MLDTGIDQAHVVAEVQRLGTELGNRDLLLPDNHQKVHAPSLDQDLLVPQAGGAPGQRAAERGEPHQPP